MAKRGRKRAAMGAKRRKRPALRGVAARLDRLDIAVLTAALDRKLSLLTEEKAQLLARIAEIDSLMAGRPAKARVGRPRKVKAGRRPGRPRKIKVAAVPATRGRGVTLAGKLAEILGTGGKSMRVLDLVEAVRQSGYPSKSPHLRGMVNQVLSKGEQFRKVRRGLYRLR